MQPERPRRGDVVKWKDHYYFFQPNGTSCFLYRYQEEIGAKARAVAHPARHTVRKSTSRTAEIYRRTHLKVPNVIHRPRNVDKGKDEV